MLRRLLKYWVFLSVVLFVLAVWQRDALPPPADLLPILDEEPKQYPVSKAAFDVRVADITYTVQPLYSYDLVGLVVSRHDSGSWRDVLHRDWNDKLNVVDLCVIWGSNARNDRYREVSFWSGQFTCFYEYSDGSIQQAFTNNALSNNHLLTGNAQLAKQIRSARIGDQIRFRGYLASYEHNVGFPFKRGTSTVRTDSGNGACETVYVENFEILKANPNVWRILFWPSAAMLLLSLLAWFQQPPRFED